MLWLVSVVLLKIHCVAACLCCANFFVLLLVSLCCANCVVLRPVLGSNAILSNALL